MNYFEYFTEIEERFTARRGSLLLLSTLDWALIETWREAGIPLTAVLRGIDAAFDRYEQRKARAKGRLRNVNGLAWCAQAVMEAAQELAEATIGLRGKHTPVRESGFEADRIASFLERNALALEASAANAPELAGVLQATAARLRELAGGARRDEFPVLDELDRTLTVLEEKLHAALLAGMPEDALLSARSAAERELAPYRTQLGAVQKRQVLEQIVHKWLFALLQLPRLSLFYMPLEDATGEEVSS